MYGAGVPRVGGPCLADQAADGDDGVGQVEERVGDVLAARGQQRGELVPKGFQQS
jgi:hypothetical protein